MSRVNTASEESRAGTLKKAAIFSGLAPAELEDLARLAGEKTFAGGEAVFWEGDAPEAFYIVRRGKVRVFKGSSGGKDFTIAYFTPGELFGEVAVFEGKPYPASAEAVGEAAVLVIRRRDFLDFLARHAGVALKIISLLGGRLREAQERLRDLAGERAERRLTRILVALQAKFGAELPFTRQEIADMSGVTTETAIRFMSRLKEGGITRSTRGKIVILDTEKLRLLAEGEPVVR